MKFYNHKSYMNKWLQLVILIFLFASKPLVAEQKVFSTPAEASKSLYKAIEQKDSEAIIILFGTDNRHLLPIADVHDKDVQAFVSNWKQSHKLIELKEDQFYITVGNEGWFFPIPIVKHLNGWYFDTQEGAEQIRIRRIGYNELAAMQFALAFYKAQIEYTTQDRNQNGTLEYAQKFISSPGKKDGLYWEVKQGEKQSPLRAYFAQISPEGQYHGYYYKILKAQGERALGGANNYLRGDQMTSGFALIAWPIDYEHLGISSFMINYQGVMYEKNLGPDTSDIASNMKVFNPGKGWVTSVNIP